MSGRAATEGSARPPAEGAPSAAHGPSAEEAGAPPEAEGVAPEAEARRLFRHVLGADTGAYPVAKYVEARERLEDRLAPRDSFDAWLLEVASRRGGTLLVDAYTRFFRRGSSFRRRLAVSMAIVECSPGTHEAFERPPRGGRAGLALGLAWRGARFLLAALVAGCVLPLGWRLARGGKADPDPPRRAAGKGSDGREATCG